jgi:hypothetical protein
MKKVMLDLEINFTDELTREQMASLTEKIAEALVHETETRGLAPEDSDAITERIEVNAFEPGAVRIHLGKTIASLDGCEFKIE